jgi:hypothetical protein
MSIFKNIPDNALTDEVKRILSSADQNLIETKDQNNSSLPVRGGGRTYKKKHRRRHRRKTYKKNINIRRRKNQLGLV